MGGENLSSMVSSSRFVASGWMEGSIIASVEDRETL